MKFYTPHMMLQEFVNCIMIVHVEADKTDAPMISPYPPSPQNFLFFYINDRIKMQKDTELPFILQPRSVMVGPQLNRVTLDVNRSHKAVRVGFHPGGLYRMLGISMAAMVDESYDATDVFGIELHELNDRLPEANHFDEIHALVEKFLLKKVSTLKRALPFSPLLVFVLMLLCYGNHQRHRMQFLLFKL